MTTRWIGSEDSTYTAGDIGFLIEREGQRTGSTASADLHDHPAYTNQSHEPRLYGWCGTTNDTAVYARGVWRVTEIAKNGRAKAEQLKGKELAAALETLGYPELAPAEA